MKNAFAILATGALIVVSAGTGWADWNVVWDDNFTGETLNPNWAHDTAGGASSTYIDTANNLLVQETGTTGNAQRASITTATDETGTITGWEGAKLYNFFNHAIRVTLDIASLDGSPVEGGNDRNQYYFSIGADVGLPGGSPDNQYGFMLEQLDTGNGPFWRFLASDNINGTSDFSDDAGFYSISGAPDTIEYTFDGTNVTVKVTGADFDGESELNLQFADFSPYVSDYKLHLGVRNSGVVKEKTIANYQSLKIEAFGEHIPTEAIAIPYEQDFEQLEVGAKASEIYGWSSPVFDSSQVIRPDISKVLAVNNTSITATLNASKYSYDKIYLDTMVRLPPSEKDLLDRISSRNDLKLAVYTTDANRIGLFHGGEDGTGGSFTEFDKVYNPSAWYRLTIFMSTEKLDGTDTVPFFQVLIEGEKLSSSSAGFNTPSLNSGYGAGTWFRSANYSDQKAANRHLALNWVEFEGDFQIDDFILKPHWRILTTLDPETRGSISPAGSETPEPGNSREIRVKDGEPVTVTFTAKPFNVIEELNSGGSNVVDAEGRETYTWHVDSVTGDMANNVIFTSAPVWSSEEGGDDKTPRWWAEERGFGDSIDNPSISMYESYLLNQEQLDEDFRIIEFGLNSDNRPFVKWRSSGQVRGNVVVRYTDDLSADTDRKSWPKIPGSTEYNQGINTWTGNQTADPRSFYHVQIEEIPIEE